MTLTRQEREELRAVAHELNNLLVAMLGNVDLALRSLPAGNDLERYLRQAESASQRAAEIAQRLLEMARDDDPVEE